MQDVHGLRQVQNISMTFSDGTRKQVSNEAIDNGIDACNITGIVDDRPGCHSCPAHIALLCLAPGRCGSNLKSVNFKLIMHKLDVKWLSD